METGSLELIKGGVWSHLPSGTDLGGAWERSKWKGKVCSILKVGEFLIEEVPMCLEDHFIY